MAIQVLKPKFHVDECLDEIKECLEKGWTGMGFKTVQFEEEWKRYTGHKYAYYLNSNTVGLHLAVQILKKRNGWNDGDEIITTPITFVSTNHAILYENLHPVFADVDEYLCLDPLDVEKKISPKTKAIIFVGYGGRVGQLAKIIEIAKKHNLKIILDAAHMSGTRVDGITPGTWESISSDCFCLRWSRISLMTSLSEFRLCRSQQASSTRQASCGLLHGQWYLFISARKIKSPSGQR